jgi:PRTRC genetic system protein B
MQSVPSPPYFNYWNLIENRPLADSDAEILFYGGSIIYHSIQGGIHQIKGLSPQSLRAAFSSVSLDSGWHNSNLVRNGFTESWWGLEFYPPQIYRIFIADRTLKIPLPGFYWLGMGKSYYLIATNCSKHHPKNVLFYPPISNIFDNLAVCWGENDPPQASSSAMKEAWELFWSSEFSNHNTNGRIRRGDVKSLWQNLHEKKRKRFSNGELLPYNLSLEEFILKTVNHDWI